MLRYICTAKQCVYLVYTGNRKYVCSRDPCPYGKLLAYKAKKESEDG